MSQEQSFVQGVLKQAAAVEQEAEKRAYGDRLTKLLQRKGKLPAEAKPNVGVSSFPGIKAASDWLNPLVGGLLGYSQENPVMGPAVGALAGYGFDKALDSAPVRSAFNSVVSSPAFQNFSSQHPVLAHAGLLAGGAGLGLGAYAGLRKLNDTFKRPSTTPQ